MARSCFRPETSEEVIAQFADRTLSEEELLESFDRLHAAAEREEGELEEPHPSASIVYSDDEYDALTERLEAPPAPSERLRRTMSSRPTSGR